MLKLEVPAREGYDEVTERFVNIPGGVIELEHSLFTIAQWESKYEKPFLHTPEKSLEETLDYISMMVQKSFEGFSVEYLSNDNIQDIQKYISSKQTATWFSEDENKPGKPKEIVTSEVVYYWMISAQIPPEYERWHLNRLMTLIRVISEKNKALDPNNKNKVSRADLAARQRALNAQRKAKYSTKG